jgi:hypothetical protein
LRTINAHLRELDDAERNYRTLVARGQRILEEREIFRQTSASIVQGYRTRDAAFRIFRNEKLERYKTLFDLAARYAFLAAQAYDYETGLLGTDEGRGFVNRIIGSRALGVVEDGQPQFAGSNTGDPGLSSVLAEMQADWSVLRGRLGFNNPDTYGTTMSLRSHLYRIRQGSEGDANWKDVLESFWMEDIMADPDVRRHALRGETAVYSTPGLVIPFSSTIAGGRNFFGNPLLAGDTTFSPASFATKIFAAGIALPGYIGLVDPSTNLSDIDLSGAESRPISTPAGSIRTPSRRPPTSTSFRPGSTRCGVRRWGTPGAFAPGMSATSRSPFRSTSARPPSRPTNGGSPPISSARRSSACASISPSDRSPRPASSV